MSSDDRDRLIDCTGGSGGVPDGLMDIHTLFRRDPDHPERMQLFVAVQGVSLIMSLEVTTPDAASRAVALLSGMPEIFVRCLEDGPS